MAFPPNKLTIHTILQTMVDGQPQVELTGIRLPPWESVPEFLIGYCRWRNTQSDMAPVTAVIHWHTSD